VCELQRELEAEFRRAFGEGVEGGGGAWRGVEATNATDFGPPPRNHTRRRGYGCYLMPYEVLQHMGGTPEMGGTLARAWRAINPKP
jgi:hypothetical protein